MQTTIPRISRAQLTALPRLTEFQSALIQTRTEVLAIEDVKEYQAKAVRREVGGMAFVLAGLFVIALGLTLAVIWEGPGTHGFRRVVAILLGSFFGAIAFGFMFLLGMFADQVRAGLFAKWNRVAVGQWYAGLPYEVQTIFWNLKGRCPKALGWVEYLGGDPFLVMADPETLQEYYVAVWDENWTVR